MREFPERIIAKDAVPVEGGDLDESRGTALIPQHSDRERRVIGKPVCDTVVFQDYAASVPPPSRLGLSGASVFVFSRRPAFLEDLGNTALL